MSNQPNTGQTGRILVKPAEYWSNRPDTAAAARSPPQQPRTHPAPQPRKRTRVGGRGWGDAGGGTRVGIKSAIKSGKKIMYIIIYKTIISKFKKFDFKNFVIFFEVKPFPSRKKLVGIWNLNCETLFDETWNFGLGRMALHNITCAIRASFGCSLFARPRHPETRSWISDFPKFRRSRFFFENMAPCDDFLTAMISLHGHGHGSQFLILTICFWAVWAIVGLKVIIKDFIVMYIIIYIIFLPDLIADLIAVWTCFHSFLYYYYHYYYYLYYH